MRLQPLRDDEVYYLAYGSNMSPQVLSGRRRVRPHRSVPCYCPGYTLAFGVQGFPWAEPGFATIKAHHTPGGGQYHPPFTVESSSNWRKHMYECSTPCLHGVLHRVTQREWALVKASEGVLGSDKSSIGYQVVEVDCVLYDDTTVVKAATLQAAPASLHSEGRDVQPSARYLKLLQDGSKHHGLDSHYQQWLSSLQPYRPPGRVAATLGSLASGAVLMSTASTAVPAYVLSRALGSSSQQPAMSAGAGGQYGGELQAQPASSMATQGGGSSSGSQSSSRAGEDTEDGQAGAVPDGFLPFVRWYTGASQKLVWDVHDKLAPWLGSGSSRTR